MCAYVHDTYIYNNLACPGIFNALATPLERGERGERERERKRKRERERFCKFVFGKSSQVTHSYLNVFRK